MFCKQKKKPFLVIAVLFNPHCFQPQAELLQCCSEEHPYLVSRLKREKRFVWHMKELSCATAASDEQSVHSFCA